MFRTRLSLLAASLALVVVPLPAAMGQCLEQRIENPTPIEGAEFGGALWIEGGTLLAGGAGGLHAYEHDGQRWALEQSISGTFSTWNDRVDFDGQRIIAGGSREANIFVRQGGRFVHEQRIDQPHPDAYSFGRSTAIEGNIAVIAEMDVSDLWVYKRESDGWQQIQFIERPPGLIEASSFPRYAYNLELEDGWLFISASNADRSGVRRAGVVVAYRRQSDGTFANPQVIATPEPGHIEEINEPVMRNGVLAVTSRGIDASATDQVVAHTFRLEGETWVYDQAVRGSGTNDRLYATIGLSPDASQMLVSDRDRGRVYAFERDASGMYNEVGRVGAESGLRFSYAGLASDGRTAYIGAPSQYVDEVPEVGAVAIIDVLCERCTADLTGDGRADVADLLEFLNLYERGDPAADFDGDGVLTPADLGVFQTALDAGCPPLPTGCQPRPVETITEFGAIGDVIVEGDLVYAHTSERGFVVLDVRNPAAPVEIASLPAYGQFDRYPVEIEKRGDVVFFFGPDSELTVADVSDPRLPEIIGTGARTPGFFGLELSGDRLAFRNGSFTSIVFDVSDPAFPRSLVQIGVGNDLAGRDGYFFVTGGYELEAGSMAVIGPDFEVLAERPVIGEGLSITLDQTEDVAYTSSLNFRGSPPVGGFLTAFDVSDPANPVEIGVVSGGGRFALAERNGYLYAADRGGVLVYDVRDPANMEYVQFLPGPSRDVAVVGHYLWAFGDDSNLYVSDIATCFPCRADLDSDGQATVYDMLAFLRLYEASDPSADFNQDGMISVIDVYAFQRAVRAGCE